MRLFGLRNAGPPNYSPHRFLDGRSKSCREAEAINRACVRLSLGTNLTRHDAIARIETTFPRVSHNGSKPERFVVISIPLSQVPWVGSLSPPFRSHAVLDRADGVDTLVQRAGLAHNCRCLPDSADIPTAERAVRRELQHLLRDFS
jgi:hypothetical protein